MARAVGVSRADHSRRRVGGSAAGCRTSRSMRRPTVDPRPRSSIAVLADDENGRVRLAAHRDSRRPLRIGHGRRSAGAPLRAGDRRAVRPAARGTSLVQARPLPSLVSRRARRLGPGGGSARSCPASSTSSASRETRSTRSPSGPSTPASSSPATSVSSVTASTSSTSRSPSAISTAASRRALVGGPTKRTIHYMETAAGDTTIGHTLAYAHAGRGALRGPGSAHARRPSAASRSSSSASPTTPAISARWRATWRSCPRRPSAAGSAATSST